MKEQNRQVREVTRHSPGPGRRDRDGSWWWRWPRHSSQEGMREGGPGATHPQGEMSGRQAEISAPAWADWWSTLWPASTSHWSSHRKIMSPWNEFMQTVVHLPEDKKMHFHFKIKTLKVLSREEQAKAGICMWAVSAHARCLISGGVHTSTVTQACWSRKAHDYIPLNPIQSPYFWKHANETPIDCTGRYSCNVTYELKT